MRHLRSRLRAPRLAETAQRLLARSTLRLPPAALRRVAGPPRLTPEGWPMDLQTQALIRLMALVGHPELHDASVDRARHRMDQSTPIVDAPPVRDVSAKNLEIPGPDGASLRLRLYRPAGLTKRAPAVLWLHGGGFVVGSIASHDRLCRALASRVPAVVVAAHYRLAPEHPFPAATHDAVAAFRHLATHADALGLDPQAIAVAGDSAGGNLAAVVSLETRADAVRPAFQALVYPATDMTRSHPSHTFFREGPILSCASIDWFLDHYLQGHDARDPLASPLFASDLTNLPPALVVTAGFDPLRDEGAAYAEALQQAGNTVTHRCHRGMVHGFIQMSGVIDEAHRALDQLADDLRRALTR